MSDPTSSPLINIGDLATPATTLIEKISDAIGGINRPYQIVRVAKAEAQAEIIRANTDIEVAELKLRAAHRFLAEEMKKQSNIEAITNKALPKITKEAKPEQIENDWIANFFAKCRLISDEEMQQLWARILAGEANSPGTFSKRTINSLGSLDRGDALLFSSLCGFAWKLGDDWVPVIFGFNKPIYAAQEISFNALTHLDSIGLINFNHIHGFSLVNLPKQITISYFDFAQELDLPKPQENEFFCGSALFTQIGRELREVCNAEPVKGFLDYSLKSWSIQKEEPCCVNLRLP